VSSYGPYTTDVNRTLAAVLIHVKDEQVYSNLSHTQVSSQFVALVAAKIISPSRYSRPSGSNDRLHRVLAKMQRGEPWNMGVIGGSGEYVFETTFHRDVCPPATLTIPVSKGHGLQTNDDLNAPTNMHRIIFDHLNALYPAQGGVVTGMSGAETGANGFINGAQGGVGERADAQNCERIELIVAGTDYYSVCFAEHIPPDVDIVLVELGE
jgi:hypothetical protein